MSSSAPHIGYDVKLNSSSLTLVNPQGQSSVVTQIEDDVQSILKALVKPDNFASLKQNTTGVLCQLRARLFEFNREAFDWEKSCIGDAFLLARKEGDRTLPTIVVSTGHAHDIYAYHELPADAELIPVANSDRSWCYKITANAPRSAIRFALRFVDSESANHFKLLLDVVQQGHFNHPAEFPSEAPPLFHPTDVVQPVMDAPRKEPPVSHLTEKVQPIASAPSQDPVAPVHLRVRSTRGVIPALERLAKRPLERIRQFCLHTFGKSR